MQHVTIHSCLECCCYSCSWPLPANSKWNNLFQVMGSVSSICRPCQELLKSKLKCKSDLPRSYSAKIEVTTIFKNRLWAYFTLQHPTLKKIPMILNIITPIIELFMMYAAVLNEDNSKNRNNQFLKTSTLLLIFLTITLFQWSFRNHVKLPLVNLTV